MSKKLLLVTGALLAAGSVAAFSSPYFREGQLRLGELLSSYAGEDTESRRGWSGKRHREMDTDDAETGKEEAGNSRRSRLAARDRDEEAEDLPPGRRERLGHGRGDRGRDRHDSADADPGKEASGSGGFTAERLFGRVDLRFSALDRNGDGFVDAEEFEAWAAGRAVHAAQRFIKRFDANGDGKVSKDETRRSGRHRVADSELEEEKITDGMRRR